MPWIKPNSKSNKLVAGNFNTEGYKPLSSHDPDKIGVEDLSSSWHQLQYLVSQVKTILHELKNEYILKVDHKARLSLNQVEAKKNAMKRRRNEAREQLKYFLDDMLHLENSKSSRRNKEEIQQFEKIRHDWIHGKVKENMESVFRESISMERQLLTIELKKNKALNDDTSNLSDEIGSEDEHEDEQILYRLSKADGDTVNVMKEITDEQVRELRDLEKDMDDLVDCYQDLNNLLKDQQSGIDAMGSNVKDSLQNVEAGVTQILSARSHQKNTRKLLFVMIGVLVLVGLLIAGGALAIYLKKKLS